MIPKGQGPRWRVFAEDATELCGFYTDDEPSCARVLATLVHLGIEALLSFTILDTDTDAMTRYECVSAPSEPEDGREGTLCRWERV